MHKRPARILKRAGFVLAFPARKVGDAFFNGKMINRKNYNLLRKDMS